MNTMSYMSRPAGPTGTPRSSGGGGEQKKWGDTTSKSGEISRIFVGSVDYKTTSCEEIEQRFQKYGSIRGIDLNAKNFVFVQFSNVEEAQRACLAENGSFFKNKTIEVRLFDKSGHPTKGRGGPTGAHNRDRSRSPNRAGGGGGGVGAGRPSMGGPTGTRHGTVLPMANEPYPPYGAAQHMPPPPNEQMIGNEAEIIVADRQQWRYAEMIEQRIKRETGIRYIDMLFLHSPSSLNMTLNDLFERQTVYAMVVSPINEEHRSVTLHVLHNQTEHRNMPLDDAILLINKDFQALNGRSGPPAPPPPQQQHTPAIERPYPGGDTANKLPEEVLYLLRTIISENGPQFLSPTQLDLLIDWLQKEKMKLLNKTGAQNTNVYNTNAQPTGQPSNQPPVQDFDKHRANLLENPHVQAALSSLIQIGALGAANNVNTGANSKANNGMTVPNNGMNMTGYGQNSGSGAPTRRHPLMGTEVTANNPQMSIPGAPGGLVKYPPPQSYNQYSYQF